MTSTTRPSDLTGDYVIDTTRTRIGFIARHSMATRVPGRWDRFEGHAHLDGDDPARSRATITIDANSIQTRNRMRDAQLRGKFLDAGNHPTITFASTAISRTGETTFGLTGDLTIRGVARPVTVEFQVTSVDADRVRFAGRATINRRDWGVHWKGALGLADRMVTLDLDIVATRRSDRG
jgi:polyisoprenoid-binding protein YceI